jgi:hypothetical protein
VSSSGESDGIATTLQSFGLGKCKAAEPETDEGEPTDYMGEPASYTGEPADEIINFES